MPDFSLEDGLGLGPAGVGAGIDEVGRGPLAGPVVAAAVVIDRAHCPAKFLCGLEDSKRLTRARRARLVKVLENITVFGLGWVERDEIDRINVLQAAMRAMRLAAADLSERLAFPLDWALVDGNHDPHLPCPTRTVVKGDNRSLSIAAASIIAKVTRDHHMSELSKRHPGYGWERNAGYGTAEHLDALRRLGPTPEHRESFAPVRAVLRYTKLRNRH